MPLSNTQYSTLMREYDSIRQSQMGLLRSRQDEISQKLPQMTELISRPGRLSLEYYRALSDGRAIDEGTFKSKLESITRMKEQLLTSAGYPGDYLELKFICPDCHDTGYIEGERCHCFKEKAIRLVSAASGLESIGEESRFDRYTDAYYDDTVVVEPYGKTQKSHMNSMYKRLRAYADTYSHDSTNLLLLGGTGTGKTYFSCAIAHELLAKTYSVVYLTAVQFFECLSSVKGSSDEEVGMVELYDYMRTCDLLIIDDIGTELANDWTKAQFYAMLTHRLSSRLPMIITTNLSMKALRDIYSERVTSRIVQSFESMPFFGDDLRKKI